MSALPSLSVRLKLQRYIINIILLDSLQRLAKCSTSAKSHYQPSNKLFMTAMTVKRFAFYHIFNGLFQNVLL